MRHVTRQRWSRERICGLFVLPAFLLPPVLVAGACWLLLELGLHPFVAALISCVLVFFGWGCAVGGVLGWRVNGPAGIDDPPPSAVLYFLGRAGRLLLHLLCGPLVLPFVMAWGVVTEVYRTHRPGP